jgi:agmatinase
MCPLVLAGIRSLCQEERDYLRQNSVPAFFYPSRDDNLYIGEVVAHLGPTVYVSVDLDVFDPSLMAAVGTPEPGGMTWHQVTSLLRAVAESRRIIGFDISELSPREGPIACSYTAAKLVYKLIAYASFNSTKDE